MSFIEWLDAMADEYTVCHGQCGLPPLPGHVPPPADFEDGQQPLIEDDDGGLHPAPRRAS